MLCYFPLPNTRYRHRAAQMLLEAEVQHLSMVRGKVEQDRVVQAAQEDYDEL